jgi:nucleoside-diphosphate-sugar epimerase
MSTVLVTGGSGFVAGHAIRELLAAGHDVRTTVRSLQRTIDVRAKLGGSGSSALHRLSFAIADLERDAGWSDAVTDCEYVLHVASPLPAAAPKDENEVIVPARDGALRVLRAARDAGVRRVVLTSSFAAIGYGHAPQAMPFDESVWTNLNAARLTAYVKSKTLAERAAWDFVATTQGALELSVVNPVAIFGPVLDADLAASVQLVKRMLEGAIPGYPRLSFGVVDVRDVAELHVRAMTHPAANGERFIATGGDFMSMAAIAKVLKSGAGPAARKMSTRELPDWLVRAAAWVSPVARQAVSELGRTKNATSDKARRVLGWSPRTSEEALLATATSLMRIGVLNTG